MPVGNSREIGAWRASVIVKGGHGHQSTPTVRRSPNIELSCPADLRTAATVHWDRSDTLSQHPRGQLQRLVMHSLFSGIPRPFHPSCNSARRLFAQSRNPLPSQTTLAHGVSYRKHEAFYERQRPPLPASSNRSALRFVKIQVRVLKRRALPLATDAIAFLYVGCYPRRKRSTQFSYHIEVREICIT